MTAALALALSLAGAPDTVGPAPPAARQVAGVAVPEALVLHDLPDAGTTLTGPGGATATVPGHAFGAAMLRTWLGDHPADERLEAALLGR